MAGAALEAHAFRVVRHEVALNGHFGASVPAFPARRLRILHLSDTHYVRGQRDKARFLSSLAGVHPDLVIATGDLLADDAGFDEFMAALEPLLELPGVFVFGSNDYFGPTPANPLVYLVRRPRVGRPSGRPLAWRRVRSALTAAGWYDLVNAHAQVESGGVLVDLRGAGDAHIQLDDYQAGTRGPSADLVLGVTHAPYRRVLEQMDADGVALALAGHTHGGQICAPWGAIVTNCDLPPAQAKGLHRYLPAAGGGAMWLHVTAGVGSAPDFPLRLFCRPEACVLDVTL